MANFEKLAKDEKPTRANMMKQIRDMDLDEPKKPAPKGAESPMSEGSRDRRAGPNKYSVKMKPGEALGDFKARVAAERKKAGYDD